MKKPLRLEVISLEAGLLHLEEKRSLLTPIPLVEMRSETKSRIKTFSNQF